VQLGLQLVRRQHDTTVVHAPPTERAWPPAPCRRIDTTASPGISAPCCAAAGRRRTTWPGRDDRNA
jgi:hypothetical protein